MPRPPKPPSALTSPDFAATNEDSAILGLDVLANDSRGLQTVVPAGEWKSSFGATITRNANGTLTYDPTGAVSLQALQVGDTVTDTFTYTAVDKKGNTYTETVTVTVSGANDAPVVTVADPPAVSESNSSAPVSFNLFADLTMASDVDRTDTPAYVTGSARVAAVQGSATGDTGLIAVAADGTVSYDRADFNFLGADERAIYQISFDVRSGSDTVTRSVRVTITGENDAPTAVADSDDGDPAVEAGVNPGNTPFVGDPSASGNVLANDTDPDARDAKSVVGVAAGSVAGLLSGGVGTSIIGIYGTLTLAADGSWSYALDNDDPDTQALTSASDWYSGRPSSAADVFTYTMTDREGAKSTTTLTVNITGTNDAPAAEPISATLSEDALSVTLLARWTDPEGNVNGSAFSSDGSTIGNIIKTDTFEVTYFPNEKFEHLALGETATDTFRFTVFDVDGASSSATATVTITGVNDAPVPLAETGSTSENAAVTIDVLANDKDVDRGAVLTLVSASAPAGKGVASAMDGQLLFDPAADFNHLGLDETASVVLSYTVEDEHGASAVSTVEVTVTGTNDSPVITGHSLPAIIAAGLAGNPASSMIARNLGDFQFQDTGVDVANNGGYAYGLAAGDVNGDGLLDFAVTGDNGYGQIFLNSGDGTFSDSGNVFPARFQNRTAFADIDGDGDLDVMFSNIHGTIDLYSNDGRGSFSLAQQISGVSAQAAKFADFDNDGDVDLFTSWESAPSRLLLNDGSGHFVESDQVFPSSTTYAHGIGDLNGDGALDLVIAGYEGATRLYLNDGAGNFRDAGIALEDSGGTTTVEIADLDSDGKADIVLSGTYGTHLWTSSESGQYRLNSSTFSSWLAAPPVDLNQDGALDLLINQYPDRLDIYANDGTGGFSYAGGLAGSFLPVVVADFFPLGAVREIADGAAGENEAVHTRTGGIFFSDMDLTDTHSAAVTPRGSGYLGSMTLAPVDQAANRVDWTFAVNDRALDHLAAGEMLTQVYEVAINDGHGGEALQNITVTITGEDDAPAPTGRITNLTNGADASSSAPAISGNGTSIVFDSDASNLGGGPGDHRDVFLYDTTAGSIRNITALADNGSWGADIAADGSAVTFMSLATNLVGPRDHVASEIFVYDVVGQTMRSVTNGGDNSSAEPRISGDGSNVVFYSHATNLVAGEVDENALPDVFLFDVATGAMTNITHGGDGGSYSPVISADRSKIVFYSDATNLVEGETDLNGNHNDIFLYDLATGVTTNITNGGNNTSRLPDISADGSKIVFESAAGNLVAGQNEALDDNDSDIFLFDVATGVTSCVTAGGKQHTEASISGDGSVVAYLSVADSWGSSERTDYWDTFLFDVATGTTKKITEGADGDSFGPELSHDGSVLAFSALATNLVDGEADANGQLQDIFVYELV